MLSFALTMAMAAPCGIPHKHKHHAPEPVQTCATPAVPMCFKQPDPDIAPIDAPRVYPYYINTPIVDDESGDGVYIEQTQDLVPGGIMPGYYVLVGGGGETLPPQPLNPPRPLPPARAPEISGAGAAGALTLLFCAIAITKRTLS